MAWAAYFIREVQTEAKRRALQGVEGVFSPEHPGDTEALRRFYLRHGFTLDGHHLFWTAWHG